MHYLFHHPRLGDLRLPMHLASRDVKAGAVLFVMPDGTTRTQQQLRNLAWSLGAADLGRVLIDAEDGAEMSVAEERELWGGRPASAGRLRFAQDRPNG